MILDSMILCDSPALALALLDDKSPIGTKVNVGSHRSCTQ
jgi:hypothetical protein